MKKSTDKNKANQKIKRKSAGTNKGTRHIMTPIGLIPMTWYSKHLF